MVGGSLNTTVLSQSLVASISQILIKSDIPCVLWGNYLLTIYGVPSIVNGIDFVVPDALLTASVFALQNKGLDHCTETKSCKTVDEFRTSPAPAAHFHISPDTTISIYKQSSTLWSLPILTLEQLGCSHDIILGSDSSLPPPRPGRGSGAFHIGYFPVYIPTAHQLLEAYVRLVVGSDGGRYRYRGLATITYIEEYVDGDGLLDEVRVEDRCGKFYSDMKLGKKPMALLFEELEASFAGLFA